MEEKDYKKLYEDVVALAKDGLKDGLYLSQSAKDVTEFLFPQLKETEDEKARKGLVRFLINFNNGNYSRPTENEIDSWIKWIDKKCKQNPEPKFKAGDWITNGGLLAGQVTSFDGEYYHYMCEGIEQPLHISNAYNWLLWTIQDAKDGDVLAAHECLVLFKKIDGLNIRCYCTYHFMNNQSFYVDTLQNKDAFHPATKEQCDLLFQKMKEAGYEWNAEKKEFNKIGQESTWNEKIKGLNELETYILSLVPDRSLDAIKVDAKNIRYIINKEQKPSCSEEDESWFNELELMALSFSNDDSYRKKFFEWLKSLKDRVQPQPKRDWSEKDAKILNEIIDELTPYGECPDYPSPEEQEYYYTRTSMIDWLKSIKDRVQPQPQPKQEWSEEDSERLLRIHQFIWANRKGDTDEIYQQEQDADWLMSIIPQPQPNQYDKGYEDGYSAAKYNQWKPTDKQMEDFRMLLDYNIGVFDYAKFMSADSLYEDLKKNLINE